MMDRSELILVLKAQQWEKCKGELRALVVLCGSEKSNSMYMDKWELLDHEINTFIQTVENDGLCD